MLGGLDVTGGGARGKLSSGAFQNIALKSGHLHEHKAVFASQGLNVVMKLKG